MLCPGNASLTIMGQETFGLEPVWAVIVGLVVGSSL